MKRKHLTRCLKTLWGAHHFVHCSKDVADIAAVINVSPKNVVKMMQSPYWDEALHYWNYTLPLGNLNLAQRLWTEMVEKGEHINLVEYPEKPRNLKYSEAVLAVDALIHSHLFCIDTLTEDEIQERLANEDNDGMKPTRYNGEDLENAYHWWVFPNKSEGLYSKVLARANAVGDLVIGSGDETSLVIIRHGRLTLTRQFSDDVANVSDERLLVCL